MGPVGSIPHYHVISKDGLREGGILRVPVNWIRRFLIESIYRRLSKSPRQPRDPCGSLMLSLSVISFPETAKWTGPADE